MKSKVKDTWRWRVRAIKAVVSLSLIYFIGIPCGYAEDGEVCVGAAHDCGDFYYTEYPDQGEVWIQWPEVQIGHGYSVIRVDIIESNGDSETTFHYFDRNGNLVGN